MSTAVRSPAPLLPAAERLPAERLAWKRMRLREISSSSRAEVWAPSARALA